MKLIIFKIDQADDEELKIANSELKEILKDTDYYGIVCNERVEVYGEDLTSINITIDEIKKIIKK